MAAERSVHTVVGADAILSKDGTGFHPVIRLFGTGYIFKEVFESPDGAAGYARGVVEVWCRDIATKFGTSWLPEKEWNELEVALEM